MTCLLWRGGQFKKSISFAGIWLSAFAFGHFMGPTVAGLAVNIIGFQRTTIIFFALYATMIVLNIIEVKINATRQRTASAYEQH